jgi:hypothetical protein
VGPVGDGYSLLSKGEYVPYQYNTIYRLDYANSILTTRAMGRVSCRVSLFYEQPYDYIGGSLYLHNGDTCRYFYQNLTDEYESWTLCATEGHICYLPNDFNIFSIAFGSGGMEESKWNSYNALVIREFSGRSILCSEDFFSSVDVHNTQYSNNPRACAYSIRKQFSNTQGFWKMVGKCQNCRLTETLTIGVSSTNTDASSESWTDSFTKSTNNGFHFKMFSNSETLSSSQSQTVMESSSHALTQMASKSFSVSCGGDVGQRYLWQWMLSTQEQCANSLRCLTNIYTAIYLCRTAPDEPRCIPTECFDDECDVCV